MDQEKKVTRKLIVKVGDSEVHLVFHWEYTDWVCRMDNSFLEELLVESDSSY